MVKHFLHFLMATNWGFIANFETIPYAGYVPLVLFFHHSWACCNVFLPHLNFPNPHLLSTCFLPCQVAGKEPRVFNLDLAELRSQEDSDDQDALEVMQTHLLSIA